MSVRFEVKTRSRTYPVTIGQNILNSISEYLKKPTGRIFVITDDVVSNLYLQELLQGLPSSELETVVFELEHGEESKTLTSASKLYDFLVENFATRSDTILAFGGGVVGDVAGFVASSFKRGMRLVHVPTTLLAQVDSTVGGKTGINLAAGKNLVGTFYQPHEVVIDVCILRSLSESEFAAGIAEVIKYGVIMDYQLLQFLMNETVKILERDPGTVATLVAKALENKKTIIELDETEDRGKREVLNFGHTIGHAIETCSNHSILHGQAVAIGMVEEARLAVERGLLERAALESLIQVLCRFGLPTVIPREIDVEKINEVVRQDKKVRSGQLIIPVLIGLGKTEIMVVRDLNLISNNGEDIQC